jgi:sugar phosphate isomerase/epimerase
MYSPKLGVSLHDISGQIDAEMLDAVRCSRIATLEVMPRLVEGDEGRSRLAALREMLAGSAMRAMTVHARFGGEYDLSVLDEAAWSWALAAFDESLEVAVALEAPMIVVHASAEPIAPEERQARQSQARRALQQIGERCQARGKRVAVELLPRTCLGNTVKELFELLDGLDSSVFGICLDTNHLMGRAADLASIVVELGSRLRTLHLSDYDGVDEKHQIPGTGILDWAAFMRALGQIGYTGPFNYECNLPGETPAQRVHALEANFAWLSNLSRA